MTQLTTITGLDHGPGSAPAAPRERSREEAEVGRAPTELQRTWSAVNSDLLASLEGLGFSLLESEAGSCL